VFAPHVNRVVIANPKQVRVIAHAKIKTDTIDDQVDLVRLQGFSVPRHRREMYVTNFARTSREVAREQKGLEI
jgi:hypothetical protein